MSTNFHIRAERSIKVLKTENIEIQSQYLHVWQTSSKQTASIISSEDPLQAYVNYVMSISKDETNPIYAENDIFRENDPIGTEVVNYGKLHIKQLKDYMSILEKDGFEFTYEAW